MRSLQILLIVAGFSVTLARFDRSEVSDDVFEKVRRFFKNPELEPYRNDLWDCTVVGNITCDIFFEFADTAPVLYNISVTEYANRGERLNDIKKKLTEHMHVSQDRLVIYLNRMGYEDYTQLWINNRIYMKNISADLAQVVMFQYGVTKFYLATYEVIDEPLQLKDANLTTPFQWGIEKIQVPEAWQELNRSHPGHLPGQGIRVGILDTGVRVTHEALRDNFFGDYGWYDPSTNEPLPTDRHGHGTHVAGTIVGSKGIGAAPAAKWMACRGCATLTCSQLDLIMCGQFFACPTLADGSNEDCSLAPHLISNSWNGARGSTWFETILKVWELGRIIPVFSIGNNGPSCGSSNTPGDGKYVIGVGATTSSDHLAEFSSLGPDVVGRLKPDLTAPGKDVVSAHHTSDDAYKSISGTSMAAPHVSGVVAILLTRQSEMQLQNVTELLLSNTDKNLSFDGNTCEGEPDSSFPNYFFGHGRLNALKSTVAQSERLKNLKPVV